MKPSIYAPMYCALYPQLSDIARKHGYAMAVHGSLARDFDLICIPWIETPSHAQTVVNEITKTFAIKQVGKPDTTLHGRERWTISIGFGECFIDLSFMPQTRSTSPQSGAIPSSVTATCPKQDFDLCAPSDKEPT